jgi:tetratricopeptide (TPR) repeat protein
MKKVLFYSLSGMFALALFFLLQGNRLPIFENRADAVQTVKNSNPAVVKFNQAGLRYFESKQFELARDQFKAALELSPGDSTLMGNLAYTWFAMGRIELDKMRFHEALAAFERAIQTSPGISSFHTGAGLAYDKMEEEESALRELEEAARLNPKESEAYRLMGEIYYKTDRPDKALEALEKALSLQPDDKTLKERIAKINQDKNTESAFGKSSSHHFIVRFEGEENKEVAQKVSDILEEAYHNIGSVFYAKSLNPIPVILYSDQSFRETVHGPAWAGGLYDGKIRIPVQGSTTDLDRLKRVLFHEYTHAVIFQLTPSPIPTWLNEGLAIHFEGNPPQDSMPSKVVLAQQKGGLIPLRQLHGSFMEMNSATSELAYEESRLAVESLINRYSVKRIRDLLEQYRGAESFSPVFEEVFLISYEDFEKAFLSDPIRPVDRSIQKPEQ